MITSQLVLILRREVRAQRRAFAGWLAPTAGLLALTLAMQPEMSKSGSLFEAKLALMPKEMLAAFGLRSAQNLADPVHWLATNFTTPMLLGALFAGLLGASVVSREEQQRTAELLLTQPVDRGTVLAAKLAAAALLVVLFDATVAAVGGVAYAAVDVGDYDRGRYALIFIGGCLAHLSLLVLALAVSVLVRRARGALSVGLGVTFGFWGVGVAAAVAEPLAPLGKLSPFTAVDAATVAATGALPDAAWALPGVMALATLLAVRHYRRKDIHA